MIRPFGGLALSLATSCITAVGAVPASGQAAAVALANAGFENGLDGWSAGRFRERMSVDADAARSGGASVRVHDPEGADTPYLGQAVQHLDGGATYASSRTN